MALCVHCRHAARHSDLLQSQLKKLFFDALRIRKLQDARDPSLKLARPATTVLVWDAIKNRMDEALERVRGYVAPPFAEYCMYSP